MCGTSESAARQRLLVELGQLALPEEGLGRGDHGGRLVGAVHQRRQLLGQRPLRGTRLRTLLGLLLQLLQLLAGLEGRMRMYVETSRSSTFSQNW